MLSFFLFFFLRKCPIRAAVVVVIKATEVTFSNFKQNNLFGFPVTTMIYKCHIIAVQQLYTWISSISISRAYPLDY